MTWLATDTRKSPDRNWCGAALVVLASTVLSASQCAARVLTKGVSVQLAVTAHAVAMPDADQAGAKIVAVTHDGKVYFGVDPITPADLAGKLGPSSQAGEKLYIKADARVPYASVAKVLDAVRAAGVTALNLLTAQPGTPEPGKIVPPKGLEVFLGSPTQPSAESTTVQVLNSAPGKPELKINNQNVAWDALHGRLEQVFASRGDKAVRVKADGLLPYADVIRAIDACRSVGVRVFLVTPEK